MECRKFQGHITAAVDNVLEIGEREKFEAHLAQCPECKSEYDIEVLTRNAVRSRCHRLRAPAHVLHRISQQLEAEATRLEQPAWWRNILLFPYVKPAIGFALASILVVVVMNTNTSINSPRVVEASFLPSNDIIKQSLANYVAVVKGEIKPTRASSQISDMQSYFEGKTEFPVVVPSMSGCTLLGGVLNEFGGKALAHFVYNHNGSEIIYLYEACWATVQSGAPFHLAQEVQDELKRTSWYTMTTPDGCTLVMWTNGKTLCSVVSKLDEKTLKTCLLAAK